MKYRIIGYQETKYEKDGKCHHYFKFHLITEELVEKNGEGNLVDILTFNATYSQELINKLLDLYHKSKSFIVYYNKFGRVEGVIE